MPDAAVDPWVRRLNALAREMDKICRATHPTAWPEQFQDMPEKWKKLARDGPVCRRPVLLYQDGGD
ncbi:MAG: hypothetical protein K6T65_13100 [Peptococcaceae bacterium]|nr:hypothetical protein [Peptococcaceae bacterium]